MVTAQKDNPILYSRTNSELVVGWLSDPLPTRNERILAAK